MTQQKTFHLTVTPATLPPCCDQLIVTSSGATHSYQSAVLGTYRKHGFSNGRYSYKNDNGKNRHFHFTPNNFWMVRKRYTTAYLLEMKMIFVVSLYKYSVSINEVTLGQPLSNSCQVSQETEIGTTTGHIYSRECTNDCPQNCTGWKIWNGNAWERDTTLSVQCKGQ